MALTRANVESILVTRLSGLLAKAGMAVTTTGSNADLNDPIAYALTLLSHPAASYTAVTDSDVTAVGDGELLAFLDVAELRTLENIAGRVALVDTTVGPRSESLGQLAQQLERMIARKREQVAAHGLTASAGSVGMGVIDLNFTSVGDDTL